MRFSIGGGIGPFRVSQRIGLPGGSSSSRPGYFAQFEHCTIQHRTAATEKRCGRKHVSPEQVAAAERAEAERRAEVDIRIAAREERSRAKFAVKHPAVAHASAEAKAGRQTIQTHQVLTARFHHLMLRSALWSLLWTALAVLLSPWFLIPTAFLVFVFFLDWRLARRVLPPVTTTPERALPQYTATDEATSQTQASPAESTPTSADEDCYFYRATGTELADAFAGVVRAMGNGTLPKVERLDSRRTRFEMIPHAGNTGWVSLAADVELVGPEDSNIVRVRWSTSISSRRSSSPTASEAREAAMRANNVVAEALGGWLP